MTGPEHYREAERLLGLAHERSDDIFGEQLGPTLAAAQAHALLALAAATAVRSTADERSWLDAAATKLGGG